MLLAPAPQGFSDFLGQLFQPYTTPSLETPEYEVLKRTKDYQIRRYQPYLVVESPMDEQATSSSTPLNPAGPGTKAFQALAGFIFGRNQRGGKRRGEGCTIVCLSCHGLVCCASGARVLQNGDELWGRFRWQIVKHVVQGVLTSHLMLLLLPLLRAQGRKCR